MNRGRTIRWLRLGAVIGTLAAVTIGPANADNGTDQITGNGTTASAVTAHWSDGLLSADNKTATPRDPNSPLKFMYPDFQNLAVTVSQTANLVHQAVKVTWSGFFNGGTNGGYLQLMQCYGDASSGPTPEGCQYGSSGMLGLGGTAGASIAPQAIGSRTGNICVPGSVPSTSNPPMGLGGASPLAGCDTREPGDPSHVQPNTDGSTYSVPFVPVSNPTQKVYGPATDYYDQFNTNEVQHAATGADGTGQAFFQTLTGTQAPGLGCGEIETNGQPRNCWLVIVPRGRYLANGAKLQPTGGFPTDLSDSPLGASNWAQRIQVRLGFDPVQSPCPIGSANEREMVGSQLAAHAVFSWQLALNAAAGCKTLYGFSNTPEATSTQQLSDTTGTAAGLAFTTIPIGSETTRDSGGGSGVNVPLVYAPMTASAITFAFNVNLGGTGGFDATPIKLTPRLLAKALTQSYREDLPDFDSNHPGPNWALKNPLNIMADPEFKKLNPNVTDTTGSGAPKAPLITEDHSGVNQQVWQWILADPSARTWLSGTPDGNGMVINPDYLALKLGNAAIDSYPRADSTCFNFGKTGSPPKDEIRCSLDLLPYTDNLDAGASAVRAANNSEGSAWDPSAMAPDGTAGWWGKGGIEPVGSTFMWTFTDSGSLANYGLVPADLCDASGGNCVSPSTASVTTAVANAKSDSTGLVHVNPAAPGSGGYPLVDVTYAAVRANQSPAALTDFARLITYAAGAGQTPGVDPGQLPHGYLPLPDSLRSKAMAAAATLLADANPQPAPTTTGNPTGQNSGGGQSSGPGGTPNNSTSGTNTPAGGSGPPNPARTNPNPTPIAQAPALAAKQTPELSPGAVRWVLLVVLIVGVVGGLAGRLLRNPAWLLDQWRRMRS